MDSLPFVMQSQDHDRWCWAAVASSISESYNLTSDFSQCRIVSAQPARPPNCCDNPLPDGCDEYGFLENALNTTENLNGDPVTRSLSFAEVVEQIRQRTPVGVRMQFPNSAHFIVITGVDEQTQFVHVEDSLHGPSDATYVEFRDNYLGSGSWSDSYLTRG